MIRAIFFDFYSVWAPDKLAYYLAYAELMDPAMYKELSDAVEKYYQGMMSLDDMSGTLRYKLGIKDVDANSFKLSANTISTEITNFMKDLHSHFVKVGILGNLGKQEYEMLNQFNEANEIIEVIASPNSFGIPKPLLDKEVFAKALEAIGESADSCLYVSGNPYHLAFARAMGLQTLQFEGLGPLKTSIDQMLSKDSPA